MFDFAGYIAKQGPAPPVDLSSVWKNYEDLVDIDFRGSQFDVENFHLSGIYRNGQEIEQAQGGGVFIAVYGACYIRIDESQGQNGKRVTAGDLLNWYRSSGLDFLNLIKGSYILMISDTHKKEVCFVTDPLNLRSLYYQDTGKGFVFSSSLLALKKLLSQLGITVTYDGASVIEYYLFDFILGDQTPLNNVRELQAGKLLRVNSDGAQLNSYCDPYSLFPLTEDHLEEREAQLLLTRILEKNIGLFTDGPGRTALALTGGYDSRSLAALTGADFRRYQYYSYGYPQSWDIQIPQLLARRNRLNHQVIGLNGDFQHNYATYAQKAIQLGDGIAEASRANYIFVYSNFLKEKESIISGLFGSELIKTPSSRGLFIDENILAILYSSEPKQKFDELYDRMIAKGIFSPEYALTHREEVMQRVLDNPFVNNTSSKSTKLFYFILMIGARKYFAKEIKLERFYIHNKTPFFDLDFVQALLRTPFPWVYNWTREKSLVKNLKIHRLYAGFIRREKGLLHTITTHGFKPGYLLSKWSYPLLAVQFFRTKKKISRESRLSFDENIKSYFAGQAPSVKPMIPVEAEKLRELEQKDFKNFTKLNSLNIWMNFFQENKHLK